MKDARWPKQGVNEFECDSEWFGDKTTKSMQHSSEHDTNAFDIFLQCTHTTYKLMVSTSHNNCIITITYMYHPCQHKLCTAILTEQQTCPKAVKNERIHLRFFVENRLLRFCEGNTTCTSIFHYCTTACEHFKFVHSACLWRRAKLSDGSHKGMHYFLQL